MVTLGAGGLVPVRSSEIVLDLEGLDTSLRQITVYYVFRNNIAIDLWSVAAISRRIRTENTACSRTVEMPTPWIECVNLHRANEQKDEGEVIFFERRVQYILTTANNWNGPIRTFHLKVVKHTSQTTYEFTRNDSHPDRELELLILQASR